MDPGKSKNAPFENALAGLLQLRGDGSPREHASPVNTTPKSTTTATPRPQSVNPPPTPPTPTPGGIINNPKRAKGPIFGPLPPSPPAASAPATTGGHKAPLPSGGRLSGTTTKPVNAQPGSYYAGPPKQHVMK
jgi:hypothetical protein